MVGPFPCANGFDGGKELRNGVWRGRAMLPMRTITKCLIEYVAETVNAVKQRIIYKSQ
jgi:hypothetical protein